MKRPASFSSPVDERAAERLAAARRGDREAFGELVEPYRRELQVHCYRLLGSALDAEDAVQETLLRGWRRLSTFEGRATLRAWLYKIATNACFDALERRGRRGLPAALYPPAEPEAPPAAPILEPIWLEPMPDEWLGASGHDVEADYALRESVRLAFVAALQALPPRQRAVLLLCDVLDWRAAEAAECLDMTVSAVNSALHRARATLARLDPAGEPGTSPPIVDDQERQALLERYVSAWEAADIAGLVALLKEEAVLNMPPSPSWYRGRAAIGRAFGGTILAPSASGLWRLRPVGANGQPAFGMYERAAVGDRYQARGVHVLSPDGPALAAVHIFLTPGLLPLFGLPDELPA